MDQKKPTLLITGVSGRIGTAAAKAFVQDYQVVGLDIKIPEDPLDGVDYLFTDLSSFESVQDSLQEVEGRYGRQIASCIHLAAYYNFTGGGWDLYEKITVEGTRNLLRALAPLSLEQFVFSSTMLVFSPCEIGQKIDEESPVDPKWEYPLSKLKTEELIEEEKNGASSVILRISGVYDDACNSIPLSQQINRIHQKTLESHFFPGDLNAGAPFLHMDDLIEALQEIVSKRGMLSKRELFVLAEEEVMSYRELQNEMGKLLHGKPWWTLQIPKWAAKWGAHLKGLLPFLGKSFIKPWMIDLADDHYDLDISRIRKALSWEPRRSLKKTLPIMIGEMRADLRGWMEKYGEEIAEN